MRIKDPRLRVKSCGLEVEGEGSRILRSRSLNLGFRI